MVIGLLTLSQLRVPGVSGDAWLSRCIASVQGYTHAIHAFFHFEHFAKPNRVV